MLGKHLRERIKAVDFRFREAVPEGGLLISTHAPRAHVKNPSHVLISGEVIHTSLLKPPLNRESVVIGVCFLMRVCACVIGAEVCVRGSD